MKKRNHICICFFEYAIPNIEYATDEKTHLAKHVQAVNEGEELSKTSFNVKFVMTLLLIQTQSYQAYQDCI